jgi:hypothetical protein
MLAATVAKAEPITEQQARAIGVDAYLYLYPLVTMDLTRKQLTNFEAGKRPGLVGCGRPGLFRRTNKHVRERSCVSDCAGSSRGSAQLRYALFVGVA